MEIKLIQDIQQLNPWFANLDIPVFRIDHYIHRIQAKALLDPEWDQFTTILVGPRQAGKTTLGQYLCFELLNEKRFDRLLYLNCDFDSIRSFLESPTQLVEIVNYFSLSKPIIFIDEVQRLSEPGLFLKALHDLKLGFKLIASGSSQLEMKSHVQEYLTGREIESLVLPLSLYELENEISLDQQLIYGSYPKVVQTSKKAQVLAQLYKRYIEKDIIEVLQLSKPIVFEKLITLIAHSVGQLVNYQQLANDCRVSVPTVLSYLDILEKTYVIAKVSPFVGNKRTEITSNPIYYFIDNGFRNQSLRNFIDISGRTDNGFLVENLIYQEILKYKTQHFYDFDIHYWRTKAQAEVDFVLYKNDENMMPIEVKYRAFTKASITRGYRSFLQAYQPKTGLVITKSFYGEAVFENTTVHFIPVSDFKRLFQALSNVLA